MTGIRSHIAGIGTYLPARVMTNADMSEIVETSDTWIRERTGIAQRHIAADDEYTSDLAVEAARVAIAHAGKSIEDIDLIVVATATPDLTFPATATIVQNKLGIHHGAAFDVHAVCSGFLYALATADNFIKAGQATNALVIGAETFSRILDWTDRTTCVLFGDGAGAMVLSAQGEGEGLIRKGATRSYVVRVVEMREYLQSLRVRKVLEAEAAALAAGKVRPEEIARVREAVLALERTVPYNTQAHWACDDEVHNLFIDACGNAVMATILRDMRVTTRLFEIAQLAERLGPDSREHLAILEAIEAGDAEKARAAMATHAQSLFDFAVSTIS